MEAAQTNSYKSKALPRLFLDSTTVPANLAAKMKLNFNPGSISTLKSAWFDHPFGNGAAAGLACHDAFVSHKAAAKKPL